jgi:hypothetical protein
VLLAFGSSLILIVLVLFALIAAMPGLEMTRGGAVFTVIAAVVTISAMGLVNYSAFRLYREQDEVQQASIGFAAKWGVPAGQAAFVLLLLLPPFKDFMTVVVRELAGDRGMTVDQSAVVVAMALGFCGVVLLQFIGTLVVRAVWWRSKQ